MVADFIHPNPKTFCSFRNQNFPFPRDVISHITKNPISHDGLLKLQKTCKYFFAKNKIVIINKYIQYTDDYLCESILKAHSNYFECKFYYNEFKYWLTISLQIAYDHSFSISKSIYRCNLSCLILDEVHMCLTEFNFLLTGDNINWLWLQEVKIMDEKGTLVSCDQILAKVPNLEVFEFSCEGEIFSTKTFEKMNSLVFNLKLNEFRLTIFDLSHEANISLLCKFIEKNIGSQRGSVYIFLNMKNAENYKIILETAANEILETWKNDGYSSITIY